MNRWTKPCLLAVLLQLHSYSLRQGLKCKKRLQRTRPAVGLFGESITNHECSSHPTSSAYTTLAISCSTSSAEAEAEEERWYCLASSPFQSFSVRFFLFFLGECNILAVAGMGPKKSNSHLETNDVNHDVNRL